MPNEETESSILKKIRETYDGKNPSASISKELQKEWVEASKQVDAAAAVLATAEARLDNAVLAMAKAYGGKSLRIAGVTYQFASRGERVFFRVPKNGEVIDLS